MLLDDYADKMGQLSGREHFYNGILNILEGINSVLTPIREAFEEVFFSSGEGLFGALKGFDEFTAKLQLSEAGAEKLKKIFKGAFSAINIGLKGVTTLGRIALTVLEKLLDLLSPVTDLLGSIGAAIGDVLTYLDVGLSQAESMSDVIEILTNAIAYLLAPLYHGYMVIEA